MPDTLVMIPIVAEADYLVQSCMQRGLHAEAAAVGNVSTTVFPELELLMALGGLGKAQFAVQTQHLIERCPAVRTVVCAGAAGALSDAVGVGDVVVATETVEHDIQNRFGLPIQPRFAGHAEALAQLSTMNAHIQRPFQMHFGPIASGDEDVVDEQRRQTVQQATGALAVAWEGAGGARACQFSRVPFVEIRGITDAADSTAASDFEQNLRRAMGNVASVLIDWHQELRSMAR